MEEVGGMHRTTRSRGEATPSAALMVWFALHLGTGHRLTP